MPGQWNHVVPRDSPPTNPHISRGADPYPSTFGVDLVLEGIRQAPGRGDDPERARRGPRGRGTKRISRISRISRSEFACGGSVGIPPGRPILDCDDLPDGSLNWADQGDAEFASAAEAGFG